MKTLITRIKRLALALCFVTPLVSWANTDLQVTITDNTVVIDNDNAETFDHMSFTVSSPVVTIPASETLPLGTQIELTSIALGKRASGSGNTRPETLSITGTDGTVYTSDAIVESGTFTNAGCTKEVYSFSGKGCVLTVGLSYAMSFKNANGSDFTSLVSRTAKNSASLFGTTVYNSNYTAWLPVQELTGEIVGSTSFTLLTGALTNINNTDTTKPAYLHNATGWISTDTVSSGEIKLVNGPAGYALTVNNGNSIADNNKNRTSVWKKLSGDGLLTTANNNWQTPAVKIYDASEFTGSINASAGNVRLAVIFCAEEDTFSPTVYEEIGSKSGLIYIKPGTSVTVAEGATWTAVNGIVNKGALTVNGTVASAISNNGGTVTLNAGASVPSFGSQRDFTGFTVHSSVPVKITMTSAEYGKGSVSVTGASGISTITVLAPDGTTTVGTITPAESSTLETGVKTTGLATWCDYEFNGDKSNAGVDKTGLTSDVDTTDYPEIFNSSMLYTYTHPYRGVTYPNSWTAVVRCTVPELENAVVVMFGTYAAGAIGLVAGSNPEEEMLLVSTPGTVAQAEDKHFTTLATMNVKDATTAQHVYVFTKDGTTVNVYCDGEKVLEDYQLASATLGGGLQVGSLHGGVVQSGVHTGLIRFGAGESQISSLTLAQQQNARIDCMRMFDYIVSPEQIAALSVEFPAVKLYRATAAADADTTWGDLSWTPAWDGGNTQSKVILTTEGDATVALPESITVDEVQLDLETDSTLTLVGPGSLAITQPITIEDGTLELTGSVTFTQDTTFNGKVEFTQFTKAGAGAIKLSTGATVGVDAALVVTPLGTYTLAEGTVVDSAYTGDGVRLMPLASAACSLTSGTTVRYYSDATGVFDTFLSEAATDENLVYTILDGTDWSAYAAQLGTLGYYYDQAAGTITRAFARIAAVPYMSLADAVAAATEDATVVLLRASSEEITLNKAITLSETANFSGTLTGNGTLTFAAFRNNPSITFTDWTGTVVLPSFAADGTILNNYGVAGSTVVLKGITSGWFGETSSQKMDVNPVLQLDGDVTITGFSTAWDYTFAEITGTGTFALDPTDNNPKSATITKVAEGFTGTVYTDIDTTLTIGTLAREAGTSTEPDTLLLSTDGEGDVVVEAVTIGGEPADVYLVYEEDGVYVGVPPVEIDPSAVVINYNSYATLSVVGGSLEGATYGWTMYTNNVACPSTQGPVKISSGKTKATVKVYSETTAFDNVVAKVAITNGEEVIEREATITVADVAAKIGETEYTKAELNDAIAAAIESGDVLEHYLSVSTTISKGQTLKTKKLAERNGSATVKAAASTVEGEAWTIAKSEEDGVITWSVGTETAYFEFTSADSQTVEYLATPKNAAGVNKLLSDATITKQFSVTKDGVVLDLNGHVLTSTYASTTAGAVYVNVISPAPAALTVKDSVGGGSIAAASAHSVFTLGSNGQLTVEGGSFTGNHIVYGSKTTSVATITGGTFTATDAGFTLNMLDTARGTITVTGGTFTGFNPANNAAEGAGTNFVPNGYVSTETSSGVWTVAEVQEVPVAPGAQTEPVATEAEAEDAAAKVVPSVPAAVAEVLSDDQETAYKALFEPKVVEVPGETPQYAVEVVLKADVVTEIQSDVDDEADDLAKAAVDAAADAVNGGEATVTTKPGLYYVVEAGTELNGIEPASCTLATSESTTLPVPNKGAKGFYKIRVSVTPVQVQE